MAIMTQGVLAPSYAQISPCDSKVIKHTGWKESSSTEWSVHLKASAEGELLYLGALHEDDPGHSQFQEIKEKWNEFRPTIAFFEGPDRGVGNDDTTTIRQFGESGYVRFLAAKSGVTTKSLEPAFGSTYRYLISRFPQEQVDIYMITKEAMRLRTRKGFTKEQLVSELNKMFAIFPQMLEGTKLSINSIDELANAFRRHWGDKLEWWQAPQEWFDPAKRSVDTGGIFTNEINTLSSDYRDVYMYNLLADHVNKGERVFAVVGRNHVPLQIPALKCAIR